MKYSSVIVLFFFFLITSININSAPFDTGIITFEQPDQATFVGRMWGDEFCYWGETEDGFRFVKSWDHWYYYAQLDESGEFTPTKFKVGIDDPPEESYQLERSQDRIDQILQDRQAFKEQIELWEQWYAQKQAEAGTSPVTLKVGLLLVEFTDTTHHTDPIYRPDGYYTFDFEDMMFSENYWYEPNPRPGYPSPHPENEPVFGSFRDYWDQMSRGKLIITGNVINPDDDQNGVPDWFVADNSYEYYASSSDHYLFINEVLATAIENGYIDTIDPGNDNYYDNIVIVYAGKATLSGSLMVKGGRGIGSNWVLLAEQSTWKLFFGDDRSFTHAGIYAHEFGHNLGFMEEYFNFTPDDPWNGDETSLLNFCLMSEGVYNGPNEKGQCPATLSPFYRIKKNWVSATIISSAKKDFLVQYDYSDPKFYRINPIEATNDEHYIFESKGREGFDLYIPGSPQDTVNQPGRLLLWHHNIDPYPFTTDVDRIMVKNADSVFNQNSKITDFFPATFNPSTQDLNDFTEPQATLGKIYPTSLTNERPAHFALNGISKLSNGNTLINEIWLNYAIDTLQIPGGWQTVSVPVIMADSSAMTVLGTDIVYKFSGGYQEVHQLDNGIGYWAKFSAGPQTIVFNGTPIDSLAMPVDSGWNIEGSLFYDFLVSQVYAIPDTIIVSIYKYENQYIQLNPTDTIKPGIGYWIKTKGAGTVFMEPNLAKITSVPAIDFALMDKFTIQDAEGYQQFLYVTNTDIDTTSIYADFEMPPYYPELPFDSRFAMSDLVKKVNAQSGPVDLDILVQSLSYPVTISWELNPANGITYTYLGDSILGKRIDNLSSKGSEEIRSLPSGKIRLIAFAKGDYKSLIPQEFDLSQNYPNPFNPDTRIKFAVPKETNVNLSVYNILGERMAELKNEVMKPGYYEVYFKAGSLPSGVYFYSLVTQKFTSTKKMILIK